MTFLFRAQRSETYLSRSLGKLPISWTPGRREWSLMVALTTPLNQVTEQRVFELTTTTTTKKNNKKKNYRTNKEWPELRKKTSKKFITEQRLIWFPGFSERSTRRRPCLRPASSSGSNIHEDRFYPGWTAATACKSDFTICTEITGCSQQQS